MIFYLVLPTPSYQTPYPVSPNGAPPPTATYPAPPHGPAPSYHHAPVPHNKSLTVPSPSSIPPPPSHPMEKGHQGRVGSGKRRSSAPGLPPTSSIILPLTTSSRSGESTEEESPIPALPLPTRPSTVPPIPIPTPVGKRKRSRDILDEDTHLPSSKTPFTPHAKRHEIASLGHGKEEEDDAMDIDVEM
ncbi:hypothetical protein BJ684DRAFT_21166 [Piptocephalis cylindrospora]|uniref:Uncharacterized protein n=1 Tax=Piptocephalis cylindrospora TaxID=1907219 RepID=A0A4V1IXU5_9FUNG|nr:hypothetical protein BJ684DRAFT_21166 [Piptocephalis cylindrospora]|eukprot:RKP12279.1 hypothetical protein BJ684DRAFT_21166 [Piptocephalis cylindrospora]